MSRWFRSPQALLTAAAIGAAVFGVLAVVFALGPCSGAQIGTFGAALASGMLVGVTTLMLLASRPVGGDFEVDLDGGPCASCGAPLVAGWRLCPYCGEMLDRDVSHPVDAGRTLRF
ncbi:MAG: zinc ribbon domain-containing protein [Clostridiales bacterium]|nr:zinc ribbon domain-containing protein [Clostridiales bacterium]